MLELGKSLALECTVRGHPIHQVVFRHNGRVIKSISGQASNLYGSANQRHLIRSKQQWQSGSSSAAPGSYFVIDGGGNDASLVKMESPEFGRASSGPKQQANGLEAIQPDAIESSRDDEDANQIKLSHVIVIVLEPQHAGAYQCFAYNQYESVQSSAYIRVLDDPPKFKDTFKSGVFEQRQDISLLCSARANPLPEITWSVDDQQIPDTGRSHFGDYVAKVSADWKSSR